MSLKNIITILLCLSATSSFAQSIRGTIKSRTGKAIAHTNVTVLNSSIKTTSNEEGSFSLELKKGKYQLEFETPVFAPVNRQQKVDTKY